MTWKETGGITCGKEFGHVVDQLRIESEEDADGDIL
jgi:hypothetical protein